jgi:hypothetical protein
LSCRCIAGICDNYDKRLCRRDFVDKTIRQDHSCIAFPERWGILFSREEEVKIEEHLGMR